MALWAGAIGKTTTTEVIKPVGSLVIVVFDGQSKNLTFRGIDSHDVSKSVDKRITSIKHQQDVRLRGAEEVTEFKGSDT